MPLLDVPYCEVTIEGKGQCLVASRDIKPLEVILTDTPCVLGPPLGSDLVVCSLCLRGSDVMTECPECHYPMCGDCDEASDHEEECRLLRRISSSTPDSRPVILSVVRTLLVRRRGGDQWRSIDKLMDHAEARRQSLEEWKLFQISVVDPVMEGLGEELGLVAADVENIIGKLNINSASFRFSGERLEGRGLYPTLSLVSHNCVANARYQVNPDAGFSAVLRAKREILVGEEISIQYVPVSLGQPQRAVSLGSVWCFECACARCSDPSEFGTYVSALKCQECAEGLLLPEQPGLGAAWRCRFCNAPSAAEMIIKIINTAESKLQDISCSPSVKLYEAFIRKNLKTFHLKHYLNLLAQRHIIELLSREPKLTKDICQKIIKNCKSYLSVMSRLDPGFSSWRGAVLKQQNYAQLQLLKLQLQDKTIDRNEFSIKSEEVWGSMKEVDSCDILCSKH